MINSAEQLIATHETLLLGVIDELGMPMIYPMEKVEFVGLEKVTFITKLESNKVRYIRNCNKCCVECHNEQDIVWLQGKVDIITDFEQIKQIVPQSYWNRLMSHANYKDYCVLVFRTETAKAYRNGKTEIVQGDKKNGL